MSAQVAAWYLSVARQAQQKMPGTVVNETMPPREPTWLRTFRASFREDCENSRGSST